MCEINYDDDDVLVTYALSQPLNNNQLFPPSFITHY